MKRVAIYCRVSTEDQSLEHQKAVLIEKCKKENWAYTVFEEKISGSKSSRTMLDILMQKIRNNEFDMVLVLKLDRLGRSLKHLIQLVEEFRNRKVQFICLSPEVDTESAQGMFFFQIMGAVAELERQLIRERTIAKLRYLQKKGIKLGRPKGSKDKVRRRRTGYLATWEKRKTIQQLAAQNVPKQTTPTIMQTNEGV
ncbi:recombinase family protein [Candidatus Woesearchaeota archaeon]|jgi:DNA invertase Pin-like site-specific DNA recombinase|nr:recombinase family protein [Candidatus Woesearchaeota archaeon]MBT4151023.1 recombinase family protein [Candidatus Woesearchaeota archaeon]MBT4247208.1 recombinase family protein [Candidatus Woesearchaeota archaeon]MBT4433813.1 recombinase family protein [Candidatus Woesearchaeota archaeon]MBT7332188.1 recombinase family protein [Candidatus Woesearchaeota archaeon]